MTDEQPGAREVDALHPDVGPHHPVPEGLSALEEGTVPRLVVGVDEAPVVEHLQGGGPSWRGGGHPGVLLDRTIAIPDCE